jgi:predicted DNA-binding transcriptional regulator AlpA
MDEPQVDWQQAGVECGRIARASVLGEDALLSPEHLAIILGCSARMVSKLRKDRRLPKAVRLGVLVRWRLADVRAWVQAGCRQQSC